MALAERADALSSPRSSVSGSDPLGSARAHAAHDAAASAAARAPPSSVNAVYDSVRAKMVELKVELKVRTSLSRSRTAFTTARVASTWPRGRGAQDKSQTVALLKEQLDKAREAASRAQRAAVDDKVGGVRSAHGSFCALTCAPHRTRPPR